MSDLLMASTADSAPLVLGRPSGSAGVCKGGSRDSSDNSDNSDNDSLAAVDREIAELEARLLAAKQRRAQARGGEGRKEEKTAAASPVAMATLTAAQHFYLLLSDSALPLGSFAFSSGLESFLAHGKAAVGGAGQQRRAGGTGGGFGADASAFDSFLPLSVASYGAASLPFVLVAHDAVLATMTMTTTTATTTRTTTTASPETISAALERLDDTYDATIICTVGRRASVAQGRALLSVWERAFAPALVAAGEEDPLRPFAQLVKRSSVLASASGSGSGSGSGSVLANPPPASAHLPPLFGAVAGLAGLDRRQTADVFMFAHVRALVSAAVRASLMGPYQAQRLLASERVRKLVAAAVDRSWAVAVEAAAQTAPVVDLWMGRHEMLYSRIFNS